VSVYERLEALNIALLKLTPPVAAFVPFLRSGNLIFLAGHIAKLDGQPWVGQLGANLTTEQGKNAARAVAIDLMSTLQAAAGDLNRIKRILKLMVLVNSTPRVHRAASGGQWRIGILRGDFWRYRNACSLRLWGRSDSVWSLCRDRSDRGGC
jgi:enamine deaminase RidA (YjgF/YER057c/UK114 family)